MNLSSEAKILYSCFLERTRPFFRDKWLDKENRVYMILIVKDYIDFRKI